MTTMMLNNGFSINAISAATTGPTTLAAQQQTGVVVSATSNLSLEQKCSMMKKYSSNSLDLTTIFEVNDDQPPPSSQSLQENTEIIKRNENGKMKNHSAFNLARKSWRRLSQRSLSSSSFSSTFLNSTALSSSLSSSDCFPRIELQQQQMSDSMHTGPDITVTNPNGRLNGGTSASGSGSETSPESDQQGVVVTFRKNESDVHSRSASSENVSFSVSERRSSNSRKSSPVLDKSLDQSTKTSSASPKLIKRERKLSSGGSASTGVSAINNNNNTNMSQTQSLQSAGPATGNGHEKTNLQKAGHALKNFLAPNYKSRSEEFRKLFKPPENDKFVIDYSCAYQREILVHGRMYMSQNLLCFYANIFKWETTIIIRFKDITSITKEKTAKVIPNAIQLVTKTGDKLFFASFSMRDKAYMMMFKIWQNALLDQPMNPAELWGWAQHGYDETEFSESDQEAEDALLTTLADDSTEIIRSTADGDFENLRRLAASATSPTVPPLVGIPSAESIGGSEDDSARSRGGGAAVDENGASYLQPKLPKTLRPYSGASSPGTTATTPAEEYTDTENETEINCPCTSHNGKEILNCVFPISVDQLFLLLFTDSVFFRKLHEDRKTTDLVLSDWQVDKPSATKSRQISYVVALNHSVGPKSCSVTEKQICTATSKPGQLYVMKCDVCNVGVPYSDTFSVGVQYCLSRVSANQCRIRVHAAVVYKKSCWGIVKSFIEKNALNGIQDYFSDLNTHLHAECARFGLTDHADEGDASKRSSARLKRRSSKLQNQEDERAAKSPSSMSTGSGMTYPLLPSEIENVAKGILIVLILMLLLNAALFYKLWYFESESERGSFENTLRDFEKVLKRSDLTPSEWLTVFHQVRYAQKKQLGRWLEELDSAIKHVSSVEATLMEMRKQINVMQKDFAPDAKVQVNDAVGKKEGRPTD